MYAKKYIMPFGLKFISENISHFPQKTIAMKRETIIPIPSVTISYLPFNKNQVIISKKKATKMFLIFILFFCFYFGDKHINIYLYRCCFITFCNVNNITNVKKQAKSVCLCCLWNVVV